MIAMTRDVSPSIAHAELTHLERVPIDYERAHAQHEQYRALLASLGSAITAQPREASNARYCSCCACARS